VAADEPAEKDVGEIFSAFFALMSQIGTANAETNSEGEGPLPDFHKPVEVFLLHLRTAKRTTENLESVVTDPTTLFPCAPLHVDQNMTVNCDFSIVKKQNPMFLGAAIDTGVQRSAIGTRQCYDPPCKGHVFDRLRGPANAL
jgi:hypothetical protein